MVFFKKTIKQRRSPLALHRLGRAPPMASLDTKRGTNVLASHDRNSEMMRVTRVEMVARA